MPNTRAKDTPISRSSTDSQRAPGGKTYFAVILVRAVAARRYSAASSRSFKWNGRISYLPVATPTIRDRRQIFQQADKVRGQASALPKWRDADKAIASHAGELLARDTVAVGVASMTKDPSSWPAFFGGAKPLHDAIVAQHRAPAGFVKPANVALFALLGHAYALSTAHAIKIDREPHMVDLFGRDLPVIVWVNSG